MIWIRKITDSKINYIVEHAGLMTMNQIADEIGVSPSTVKLYLSKLGISNMKTKKFKKKGKDYVKEFYANHYSIHEFQKDIELLYNVNKRKRPSRPNYKDIREKMIELSIIASRRGIELSQICHSFVQTKKAKEAKEKKEKLKRMAMNGNNSNIE